MKRRETRGTVASALIAVWVAASAVASAAETGSPASKPAAAATSTSTSRPEGPPRYTPVPPEQVEAFRKQAEQWAEQAKEFSPRMHRVETKHFLIFSDWHRSDDRALAEICETMYRAMAKQFDLPAGQNIWAGKCPLYVFWKADAYRTFTREVDQRRHEDWGGYCVSDSRGFVYIVMNRVKDKHTPAATARTRFYALLVHEATHGFLARYINNRPIPQWLNEGLAEYMAARLVPASRAAKRHVRAAKQAVTEEKSIAHVFEKVESTPFDYGVVQSLVRYLLARSRKGMVRLVSLIKQGTSEADALRQAYQLDRDELAASWRAAVARSMRRR